MGKGTSDSRDPWGRERVTHETHGEGYERLTRPMGKGTSDSRDPWGRVRVTHETHGEG